MCQVWRVLGSCDYAGLVSMASSMQDVISDHTINTLNNTRNYCYDHSQHLVSKIEQINWLALFIVFGPNLT